MKQETLDRLETVFNADKIFVKDGYYRIRSLPTGEKELAFLVVDSCGATAVHPQITIAKLGEKWVAIRLFDLQATPPQRSDRTTENSQQLDQTLQVLIDKFQTALLTLEGEEKRR